jgi:hypothetical protein
VDFRLQLTQSAALAFTSPKGKIRIEGALNLVARFGSSNMHLWGPDGTIKRYNGPSDIIEDFFAARLRYYELRKEALSKRLGAAVTELANKHRFAGMIVEGSLALFRKSRAEVEAALAAHAFDPHPERGGFQYACSSSLVLFFLCSLLFRSSIALFSSLVSPLSLSSLQCSLQCSIVSNSSIAGTCWAPPLWTLRPSGWLSSRANWTRARRSCSDCGK